MSSDETIIDNPTGWVRSHIRDYVESNGKKGHRWRGLPTLLLITRGRISRVLRRTALIYGRDGHSYVLVASNGGAPTHPFWYVNLVEIPEVKLQVGADTFIGLARTATSTERDIPVVIVEPM